MEVFAAQNAKNFIISIKDTGIGIAKDDLPYIFERFYRTDISRTKATGGKGLGLAIVKRLVHLLGGEISVESELNVGTNFVVNMPILQKTKNFPTKNP